MTTDEVKEQGFPRAQIPYPPRSASIQILRHGHLCIPAFYLLIHRDGGFSQYANNERVHEEIASGRELISCSDLINLAVLMICTHVHVQLRDMVGMRVVYPLRFNLYSATGGFSIKNLTSLQIRISTNHKLKS